MGTSRSMIILAVAGAEHERWFYAGVGLKDVGLLAHYIIREMGCHRYGSVEERQGAPRRSLRALRPVRAVAEHEEVSSFVRARLGNPTDRESKGELGESQSQSGCSWRQRIDAGGSGSEACPLPALT